MSQPYDFTILTDSSADLGEDLVREMDIQVLPLSFTIQDKTYHNYPDNHELSPHTFYKMLREGQTATTAAVNVEQYLQAMEPELQAGRDVLVLAFSSGLSATYNSSSVAAEELREKYPERKIYTVDTLCASLGQGPAGVAGRQRAGRGQDHRRGPRLGCGPQAEHLPPVHRGRPALFKAGGPYLLHHRLCGLYAPDQAGAPCG